MNNLTAVEAATCYKCEVCNHIYDPKKGDTTTNVSSGTSFEDLPEGWKCPICGVGKESFTAQDEGGR